MKKNLKLIVFIAVFVGILAVLHLFIFGPMKSEWDQVKTEIQNGTRTYKTVLELAGGGGKQEGLLKNLESGLAEELKNLQAVVSTDKQNYQTLVDKYNLLDDFQPEAEYRGTLLQRINEFSQLEETSTVTKLDVSHEWGVNPSLGEGKFGPALRAYDGHTRTYTNFIGSGERPLNEKEGSVE